MWNKSGIQEESQFQSLLFNRPANCLIAQFSRTISQFHSVMSLYVRCASAAEYTKISKSDVHISYCDPVSCSKHPFLIFNIWSHSSDDLSAMDWVSVSRLNLLDLSVTPILNEDNLIVPRGYNRGWVSSILSARQDGEGIICTVGLQKQESRSFHQVDYWICEIPFKSKKIKKIADLPDTFI